MNNTIQQSTRSMTNTMNDTGNYISQTANNTYNTVSQSINNSVRSIDVIPSANSTREFLESNSLLAKFSFLIMAIFIFVILLKIFIRIIAFFLLNKSGTVKLIDGMIDGNEPYVFPQDPTTNSNAKTLSKSNNQDGGVEFSWSCWLYVNSITTNPAEHSIYKHVFSKGNNNWNTSSSNPPGVSYPNNSPGVYLSPTTNDLYVFMNTYDVVSEEIVVNAIPLNKWFNLTICCVNKSLDVYINGIVVNSHQLISVPKQNYGDVFVCNNGGFSGNLSNLIYYNKAISLKTIQQIVSSGPNFNLMSGSKTNQKEYNYLSMDWYFNNPIYGI